MKLDAYNIAALQAGAQAQGGGFGSALNSFGQPSSDGWRGMDSAPRDGTIIELRCTYGIAPWYGLFFWSGEFTDVGPGGEVRTWHGAPRWQKAGDPNSGVASESSLSWRPTTQSAQSYADPTGGFQNSAAYWRGAVAAKYGLPLTAFEADVERREAPEEKPRGGLAARIMRALVTPNREQ